MVKTACILLLIIAAFQYSCKHEIPVSPTGNYPIDTITTGVCFQSDILPLFQSNCAKSGCHDAATRTEGYQLNSYASIISRGINPGNAGSSKIYEVINDNDPGKVMPPPPNQPLTAAQKSLIAAWITEGARNTINCNNSCDSSIFTYSGSILPMLQSNCLGCHSGTAASGGFIVLDSYINVKTQVTNGRLYASVAHTGPNPMPKDGNKLSDCKIAQLRKWIEAGAQNN